MLQALFCIHGMNIAATLSHARKHSNKLLVSLLDPQGQDRNKLNHLVVRCKEAHKDLIFIGESLVYEPVPDWFIMDIKEICDFPCVLFPAQLGQINALADGIKSPKQACRAAVAGADPVVISNAVQLGQADISDFPAAFYAVTNSIKK